MGSDGANLAGLVTTIARTHALFAAQASKAINVSLTLRNWLIGHHIAEYELQGADRADYGGRLLARLALQLGEAGLRRIDARELRRFRQFYAAYPQIREAVTPVLAALPAAQRIGRPEIRESVTPESNPMAQAGMTNKLFVSRYQLLWPAASDREAFLRRALGELGVASVGDGA